MSWEATHRRMDALREVEAELERNRDGVLPWRPEYKEIFGDAATLLAALRNRWAIMLAAQVEQIWDTSGKPSAAARTLAEQHQGLLKAITRPVASAVNAPRALVSTLATRQDQGQIGYGGSVFDESEGAA